ncbi:hypothetical protein FB567DRAFT_539743 [Paraphoma chrysanthemicola]|uniref:Uncharacterized protein n=1 Tax=Paraphoma chrysanthemicola TaxID=798071 RepID=A0A8K0VRU2_9PLEO|nr:hypothetical protein FB567DRAFT_539743 [Paraphoma chrysanthemicola]
MIFNPDTVRDKVRLTAILVAELSSAELDVVQNKFGLGANFCNPYPAEELFIHDRRSWSSHSHAAMMRAMSHIDPLLVIDAQTPHDGGIWYIEGFAEPIDVETKQAENTNTLFKVRMKIEDVVISYQNYSVANTSIRDDMQRVNIPFPIPETFTQETLFTTGIDFIKERYTQSTWITATPDELQTSTESSLLDRFLPRPEKVYRLPQDVARANGLKSSWTRGTLASLECGPGDEEGEVDGVREGSLVLQVEYDPKTVVPRYGRPEGSL